MKALILAAGLGSRLAPFTNKTPKPLFTVAGRPLLDIIILSLQKAGCTAIIINTHHLYQKIESFILRRHYSIPVATRYEPEILGTGGAIKNVENFFDDQPFMVVNSDIITDIDFKEVYEFHCRHHYPVTLALNDYKEFNTVLVNQDDFVIGFIDRQVASVEDLSSGIKDSIETQHTSINLKNLTFTGIQVLDPEIFNFLPANLFSSSIDAYQKMILKGKKVKSLILNQCCFKDIGTPERYKNAVFEKMAPAAFQLARPDYSKKDCHDNKIKQVQIEGDGSDRSWFRLVQGHSSLIMADHGINTNNFKSEAKSFVAIGRHLYKQGIPVPKIHLYDTFSGFVFMDDLGDTNLQSLVLSTESSKEIVFYYQTIIKLLIKLSISGAKNFDLSWTYQTSCYNDHFILEYECRYFVDAFLNRHLGLGVCFEAFLDEFRSLAHKAIEFSVNGFMHRDLQSRNIMVKNNHFYFIDFQGGRLGPIQYDLASLLIDPYVKLSLPLQTQLLAYCIAKLSQVIGFDENNFRRGYQYCAISRNLQILGAFGHLINNKGKTYFKQYIPAALKTLFYNLSALKNKEFSGLISIITKII